eukprot:TRINITY_DN2306_c0_g1_i1.p1 TRINITY_DN2306_c0_g1~~TRINITY_DN2306_c0_g1_i1.p1  ORF type:complete len:346 (-),score=53.30 TRINITY_DN2306_c0_g1_i1:270-1187(-)
MCLGLEDNGRSYLDCADDVALIERLEQEQWWEVADLLKSSIGNLSLDDLTNHLFFWDKLEQFHFFKAFGSKHQPMKDNADLEAADATFGLAAREEFDELYRTHVNEDDDDYYDWSGLDEAYLNQVGGKPGYIARHAHSTPACAKYDHDSLVKMRTVGKLPVNQANMYCLHGNPHPGKTCELKTKKGPVPYTNCKCEASLKSPFQFFLDARHGMTHADDWSQQGVSLWQLGRLETAFGAKCSGLAAFQFLFYKAHSACFISERSPLVDLFRVLEALKNKSPAFFSTHYGDDLFFRPRKHLKDLETP